MISQYIRVMKKSINKATHMIKPPLLNTMYELIKKYMNKASKSVLFTTILILV